ncbi:MAG: serine hydrolase domain-containing protein [Moraxella sp.]|nr:serine hydrolase domain-containing protein [Moraxella sp.]
MVEFSRFDDILPKLVFDDSPCGGALTIFQDGQCVVNTAFGQANAQNVWTPTTLSVNFSIGKGVMATLIAVLVSQGLLAYDKPISTYWQAFGVNGKQAITLEDVLRHRAGLFNITKVMSAPEEAADWQAMCKKIADMPIDTPIKQGDTVYASAYSALVSGWILGAVVEKVTQLPLQQALETYLTDPLGVTGEMYFGLPAQKLDDIALPYRLFFGEAERKKPTLKPDSPETKAFLNGLPVSALWQKTTGVPAGELTTATINRLYFDTSKMVMANYKNALLFDGKTPLNYHDKHLLGAPIPAANGISSSRALAVMYAMHANEGIWQDRVVIDKTVLDKLRIPAQSGFDAVMPADMRWRLGFHRLFSVQEAPSAYGHMGYNGSVAFCDPSRRLAVAFIHNFDTTMLNDVRQFVVSELALLASDTCA